MKIMIPEWGSRVRLVGGAFAGLALCGLLVSMLCLPGSAQQSPEEELRGLNAAWAEAYGQKNWPEALRVVGRLIEFADRVGNRDIKGGALYNKACVLSLTGDKAASLRAIREAIAAGYTDAAQYSQDPDFESLRGEPEFRALLAELKEKFGPRPLDWDRNQSPPQFPIMYDDGRDPEFLEMKREFGIDAVVAGAKDDYDRLRRLTAWVSTRWHHSPNQTASKGDPLTILREARAGGRFICRDYAIVLAGVASAYGFSARVINLLPRDVETRSEAHSVAEVWLESLHKWVLADGQYGAIGELDGVPLSGLDLQAAFAADKPVRCAVGEAVCAEWKPFILRNAYYFKTGNDARAFKREFKSQLVLVPKGAPAPHKFAGGNEEVFAGAIYTSNPETFYAPPPGRG